MYLKKTLKFKWILTEFKFRKDWDHILSQVKFNKEAYYLTCG